MKYNKNLIKFNLKNRKELNIKTQIFLIFVFDKKRLRYFTGKRIEPKYWDFVKQRVKPSYPNYNSFNKFFLSTMANFLEDKYNKLQISEKKMSVDDLKMFLDERLNKVENTESLFKYFDEFVEVSKNERKKSTIKAYKATISTLKKYERAKNVTLTFETVTHKFDEQFKDFLITHLKLTNYANQELKII